MSILFISVFDIKVHSKYLQSCKDYHQYSVVLVKSYYVLKYKGFKRHNSVHSEI
jgi:hypothetical protein